MQREPTGSKTCVECGKIGPQKRCHSCSAKQGRICSEGGCDRAHYGLGFCRLHYKRWKAHGDTLPRKGGKPYAGRTPEQVRATIAANVRIDPATGCWLWTKGLAKTGGYPSLTWRGYNKGNRVSYAAHHGRFPMEMWVLHRCDVPACVNPDHLFLGTAADNNADRDAKGRTRYDVGPMQRAPRTPARGETNGSAKLTEDDVRAIREDQRLHRIIAEQYGVSTATVSAIKTRRKWRHVT